MKKVIFILILIAISVVSMATKVNRSTVIRTGSNQPYALSLGSTDFVEANDTLDIAIDNKQKFMQHFVFTTTLTTVSGSPSVSIEAWGKVNSGDSWVQIGSTNTWTSSSNNPVTISSTTPANYNYLLLRFIASGATQKAKVSTFELHTSNVYDIPANSGTLTVSRATSGTVTIQVADDNSNAAAVYRAGGTGALTLGAATGTTSITSSDWAISAAGNMTGIGTIAADGKFTGTAGLTLSGSSNLNVVGDGDSIILNAYQGGKMLDARVGGATKFFVDSSGNAVAQGYVNAVGGIYLPNASPVIWAKSGPVNAATVGGDSAGVAARRYWVEIYIPYNVTLTGVSYLVGSVGGTDSVVVQLCNYAGTEVATSRAVGTAAALVGTAAQFQSVPFSSTYAATAGKYFVAIQLSGTTAKLRTHSITGCKFIAGSAGGTWGTKANITPGSTYTVGKAPFLMTY
jgi:hypothetical protein